MKQIVIIMLVLAPLFISAQGGLQYEYLLKVSGIEDPATCKMVYAAIYDHNPAVKVGHHDQFIELKLQSPVRLEEADLIPVLSPLGVSIQSFVSRAASSASGTKGSAATIQN